MSSANIPILTELDCTLLNLTQLAGRLNVAYDYVKDMRRVGFECPFGGLTTLTHALNWINRNPNFREQARRIKLLVRPARASRHLRRAAGKSDALPSRRDEQSSSPDSRESPHELAA